MITESLFNAESVTANSVQLEQLKQLFPNCFDTSGRFLLDKFQAEIESQTEISREFYAMDWLGKSYAKLLRNLPPETLLAEDKAHNAKSENATSQNLLICGDNLEVLKHLKNAYRNQVKMIYIDPPYNTGSDGFVYQDDRKFTPQQLVTLANLSLEEAERILTFTDKGSNSHSAWLTFMYPRLYIARELLKEDGVVFISIDDNEVAQLKLLCDDVFGEGNFVSEFIHIGNSSKNKSLNMSVFHEYALIYAKNKSSVNLNPMKKNNADEFIARARKLFKELSTEATKELRELTKYPRFYDFDHYTLVDEKGVFRANDLTAIGSKNFFDILHPITKKPCKTGVRGWAYSEEGIKELLAKDLIYFGKDENTIPQLKGYLEDNLIQIAKSVSFFDAQVDTKKLKREGIPFDFTKPVALMQYFISIGSNSDDIILDFFAGSGTTAHAVQQLNAEDNSNRQFILVQLPEKTGEKSEAYKAGYKTIFEITKARIEKSAVKIRENFPNASGDFGFKIYQTVDNFRKQDDEAFSLEQATLPFASHLSDEQLQTLLTTWALNDGAMLTTPILPVKLGNYTAYLCEKRLYLMHEHFESKDLLTLMQKLDNDCDFNPNRVILFGENIPSHIQQEIDQALNTYRNRKNISLSLIVRN
ncbi:site-specific DNA-methyltransferase [[Pasteurella] aerogenes]|nr:site-specific DNA-methyltransferase [[Pasteurella] aerogenes]